MDKQIEEEILAIIKALQADKRHGPWVLLVPDKVLIAWGFDPNDYPEHTPGVREVRGVR